MTTQNQSRKQSDLPLPTNVSAEKAILGAILLDNAFFADTVALDAEDFSLDAHRRIYHHIAAMVGRGEGVDPITLVDDMRTAGALDAVGSMPIAYIADLSADTIRYRQSVRQWVRIVKAKSLRRKLIMLCTNTVRRAYDDTESGFDIIATLKEQLTAIETSATRGLRPS